MNNEIYNIIHENAQVNQALMEQVDIIQQITKRIAEAIASGHKLLLCGNGGSAADAQHVAAEFVGRFLKERTAWPAIALTANTSILTALGNDYHFEIIFARQIEALGQQGDIVVGITTSGNSADVLCAMQAASKRGCITIGFTGSNGGKLKDCVDICLRVPSDSTPRIQEAHILAWHIICELVENILTAVHG